MPHALEAARRLVVNLVFEPCLFVGVCACMCLLQAGSQGGVRRF